MLPLSANLVAAPLGISNAAVNWPMPMCWSLLSAVCLKPIKCQKRANTMCLLADAQVDHDVDTQAVDVSFASPSGKRPCTITFTEAAEMSAILARCTSTGAPKHLLDKLFEGDAGNQWPHAINVPMQTGKAGPQISAATGKPYRRACQTSACDVLRFPTQPWKHSDRLTADFVHAGHTWQVSLPGYRTNFCLGRQFDTVHAVCCLDCNSARPCHVQVVSVSGRP